jgi:hypothetical protein
VVEPLGDQSPPSATSAHPQCRERDSVASPDECPNTGQRDLLPKSLVLFDHLVQFRNLIYSVQRGKVGSSRKVSRRQKELGREIVRFINRAEASTRNPPTPFSSSRAPPGPPDNRGGPASGRTARKLALTPSPRSGLAVRWLRGGSPGSTPGLSPCVGAERHEEPLDFLGE